LKLEVSKAIGRGHNIKLAGLLTGYELDVIEKEMLLAQLPMMMMLS
jgi:transcription antitermination factor NusA-like protein